MINVQSGGTLTIFTGKRETPGNLSPQGKATMRRSAATTKKNVPEPSVFLAVTPEKLLYSIKTKQEAYCPLFRFGGSGGIFASLRSLPCSNATGQKYRERKIRSLYFLAEKVGFEPTQRANALRDFERLPVWLHSSLSVPFFTRFRPKTGQNKPNPRKFDRKLIENG